MKKTLILAAIAFLLPAAAMAQERIPLTDSNGVLENYFGKFKGKELMSFIDICMNYMSLDQLRRDIFAKYGKPFKSPADRKYYYDSYWYEANPKYHEGLLTEIDFENIARIDAIATPLPEDDPFILALQGGNTITSEKGELAASLGKTSRSRPAYIFDLPEPLLWSQGQRIFVLASTVKNGGFDSGQDNCFFKYQDYYYLILNIETGLHGTDDNYFQIRFSYDSRKFAISEVIIEGPYED